MNFDKLVDIVKTGEGHIIERKVPEFDKKDFSEDVFENFRKEVWLDRNMLQEDIEANIPEETKDILELKRERGL